MNEGRLNGLKLASKKLITAVTSLRRRECDRLSPLITGSKLIWSKWILRIQETVERTC